MRNFFFVNNFFFFFLFFPSRDSTMRKGENHSKRVAPFPARKWGFFFCSMSHNFFPLFSVSVTSQRAQSSWFDYEERQETTQRVAPFPARKWGIFFSVNNFFCFWGRNVFRSFDYLIDWDCLLIKSCYCCIPISIRNKNIILRIDRIIKHA